MPNGFKDSGIRMNGYIADKDNWGLAELEDRSQYLATRALQIWEAPDTEFVPEEKQMDSCTLEDDVNLSGRTIAKFHYKNTEQPVSSWIDLYERILKILHADDKSVLSKLAYTYDSNVDLAQYVSNKKEDLRESLEIDTGLYVERNTSTGLKMSLLRRFFKLYGAEPSDLIFYLRNDKNDNNASQKTRQKIRKKYWTFALDFIREAHKEDGCFSNVNPSSDNWINGFFGIGGFSITCVANFEMARVELCLAKSDREKNKKAFDYLMSYKGDIEEKLGVPLNWMKNEEIKSSSITICLKNVGIEQEADWLQMAKFHAEWSKKFYDIFVPYLREMSF